MNGSLPILVTLGWGWHLGYSDACLLEKCSMGTIWILTLLLQIECNKEQRNYLCFLTSIQKMLTNSERRMFIKLSSFGE